MIRCSVVLMDNLVFEEIASRRRDLIAESLVITDAQWLLNADDTPQIVDMPQRRSRKKIAKR